MLKLFADENFNGHIFDGLLDRRPDVDLVRVQDVGLTGAKDPDVLAWAAEHSRILLTHDFRTMSDFAYDRVKRGDRMPGVFLVKAYPIATAIDDLLLALECSTPEEWENMVIFIPF